ncbi:MAG: hypothetical protein IPQ06_05175 [Chitinophagaceae bacterium]|nr:hypothetical protein [Chitinophagaceae bacterium]MBL0272463.1 hypothetical protein [Chitinophagaceae bacterium]
MNDRISKFIEKQTCANVCCVDEKSNPYCFSCFYAFHSGKGLLYFKSSSSAHHSSIIANNRLIAGTILPDKLNTVLVKGIQFEGVVLPEEHPYGSDASGQYHKKFPMALMIPGEIWIIQINSIKMTDSAIGFGKKITWNREEIVTQD